MKAHQAAAAAAVLAMALFAPRAARAGEGKKSWLDLALYGGFASPRVTGTTLYEAGWSANYLSQVDEQTSIANFPGLGLAGGASATFYSGSLGLQVLFGAMRDAVNNGSSFSYHWIWASGTEQSQGYEWDSMGTVSSLNLSLNLAARFGAGKVQGVVSGGLTLFHNTFSSDSTFGYGVTTVETSEDDQGNATVTQNIDALPVRLRLPSTSWNDLGFNIGAGLDVEAGKSASIVLEARYFVCRAHMLHWSPVYGKYDGIFSTDMTGMAFGAAEAAEIASLGQTFDLAVNPSYFQICLGVVFHIGGPKKD